MKKVVTFFTLLISGNTALVNAQSGINNFKKNNTEKNLVAFNFIENFSLPAIYTILGVTATPMIKNEAESTQLLNNSSVDAIENVTARQIKYAMLMDVEIESIKDGILLDFVEEWYGTRYRMGGTTKKGIDCSALTRSLMCEVYQLQIKRTAREQYKNCEHIKKEELKEGDLVFFNTRGGVSHVGVYINNGYFVHSGSSKGVMISSLYDGYFCKRFIGGGRVN